MHQYYTPISIEFQAHFVIFVNYADILCQRCYVNFRNFMRMIIYHFRLFPHILGLNDRNID